MAGICLASALGLTLSCSRAQQERPQAKVEPLRGDWLVVEQTAGEFFRGRVLSFESGRLKLQRADDGSVVEVGESDTYRIPSQAPRLVVGSYAICETARERWESCRMVSGAGEELVAEDVTERQHRIGPRQTIEPTSLTALNIRRRFEEAGRRRAFQQSIRVAGPPRKMPEFVVAPERLVLVEREGRWFGAKVIGVDDDRVVIRWAGQTDTAETVRDALAPQPPTCGIAIRGDRALRRPNGYGAPWEPVLVVAADSAEATVEDVERTRAVVQQRDLCPLGTANTSVPKH